MFQRILLALIGALLTASAMAQDTTPVYQFSNGRHHYYSTNYQEGAQQRGYRYDGAFFKVYTHSFNNIMQPLWRCIYTPQNEQFISKDNNCEGWAHQGLLGFVAPQNYNGHAALWRFTYSNGSWQDHLATINYNEAVRAGYRAEGILGYAPF